MYRAKRDGDEGVFRCKRVDKIKCFGYKLLNEYFVDNSGFGTDGEMALTANSFLNKVKAGYFYGITNAGQFQVYIGEFEKVNRAEQLKERGIISSKLVKRNTRLTEYADGSKVLTLHSTDIITWRIDGVIILNSGGWYTHTTKARLNEFLPDNIKVYQKNYQWYIIKDNDYTNKIEFKDGIQI